MPSVRRCPAVLSPAYIAFLFFLIADSTQTETAR